MRVRVSVDVYDDAGRRVGKLSEWHEVEESDGYGTPPEETARRIMAALALVVAIFVGWVMFG